MRHRLFDSPDSTDVLIVAAVFALALVSVVLVDLAGADVSRLAVLTAIFVVFLAVTMRKGVRQ